MGHRQQRKCLLRPILVEPLDPPQRMVVPRHRVALGLGDQRLALTHKAPQHGIHKPGRCGLKAARSHHGLIGHGVVGVNLTLVSRRDGP